MLLKFATFLWDSEQDAIEQDYHENDDVNLLRYGLKTAHYAGLRFTDFIRFNDKKHGDHYLYDLYDAALDKGVRKLMSFARDPRTGRLNSSEGCTVMNTYYAATHATLCGVGSYPEKKRFHLEATKYLVLPFKSECAWIKCEKGRANVDKMYQCKGCRMVNYCCRNHQKKDWALIHSNECLGRKC